MPSGSILPRQRTPVAGSDDARFSGIGKASRGDVAHDPDEISDESSHLQNAAAAAAADTEICCLSEDKLG